MKRNKILSAVLCIAMLLTATALPAVAAKETCPASVNYALGNNGVSADLTAEKVVIGKNVKKVPEVITLNNVTFLGWSTTDPAKVKEGEEIKLVDPAKVKIEGDTTFYAVYEKSTPTGGDHEHYMKGYPNGDFGPADNITRGEVAAIIARACLSGFHEDKDYGNGGYGDIDGTHWATSAIAYTTMAGVYQGYDDGNFYPDKPITRQEFALVFARMVGLQSAEGKEIPFSDIGDAGFWAVDGIYTAYTLDWVNGYTDGTFKPLNNIARSEAAKIVNRYLNRSVDEAGIKPPFEQIKQWPDVPETYWAYHEILEATNGHTYIYVDGEKPPEAWSEAYIREAQWGM